jgi:hypothetical protein
MRRLAELAGGDRLAASPFGSGTRDADAQTRESETLPAFATTRRTEIRLVGGRTEVEPEGGSCTVVVVAIVGIVVVVVDVVVDEDVEAGIVVEVVVEVVADVEVVDVVVVVGRPVIRTTGG